MNLYDAILDRVPQKWRATPDERTVTLQRWTDSVEYNQIEKEVVNAVVTLNSGISSIIRVQNVFDYGQFLIREQLLVVSSAAQQVYSVRRFIKIKANDRDAAMKYNLDPRRCSLGKLTFTKTLAAPDKTDVVFVVRVLTHSPNDNEITPKNSLEYYIEYCVEFQ